MNTLDLAVVQRAFDDQLNAVFDILDVADRLQNLAVGDAPGREATMVAARDLIRISGRLTRTAGETRNEVRRFLEAA